MAGKLMSTNAFEVSYNGTPIWSKIESGRFPEYPELAGAHPYSLPAQCLSVLQLSSVIICPPEQWVARLLVSLLIAFAANRSSAGLLRKFEQPALDDLHELAGMLSKNAMPRLAAARAALFGYDQRGECVHVGTNIGAHSPSFHSYKYTS